mgnify:CR=1 FL=1
MLTMKTMSHSTATRIDEVTEQRMAKATAALNLKPADFLRIGLFRVLEEYESTGQLAVGRLASHNPPARKGGNMRKGEAV